VVRACVHNSGLARAVGSIAKAKRVRLVLSIQFEVLIDP